MNDFRVLTTIFQSTFPVIWRKKCSQIAKLHVCLYKNFCLHFFSTEGILWISSCILAAILTTLFWTGVIRFTLRLLFSYQAWMYMSREQLKSPSIIFKFWASLVGALCSLRRLGSTTKTGKPLLLAYQGALPTLPLPSVKDTLRRYVHTLFRNLRFMLDEMTYFSDI